MIHCWGQDPPNPFHFQVALDTLEAPWMFHMVNLGWGLHEYQIHLATLTLVVKCQYLIRMKLSHIDVPINLYKYNLYTDSSSNSFLNTLAIFGHLTTLIAQLRLRMPSHLYYRSCWHRFSRDQLVWQPTI